MIRFCVQLEGLESIATGYQILENFDGVNGCNFLKGQANRCPRELVKHTKKGIYYIKGNFVDLFMD